MRAPPQKPILKREAPDAPRVTTEDVQKLLPQLFANRDKLLMLTVKLGEVLKLAERSLVRLRLGVVASVGLKPDSKVKGAFVSVLRFEKWEGSWGLVIDDGEDIIPLARASREERMLVTDRLPAMLLALAQATETMAGRVEPRMGTAADIAYKLRAVANDEI